MKRPARQTNKGKKLVTKWQILPYPKRIRTYDKTPSLLERSIGFWLLIGTLSCSATVYLGSTSRGLSAHGTEITSTEQRVEGNTDQRVEVQEATVSAKVVESDKESEYIAEAVNKYLPKHKSEALMIMHCLAHREARHGESKGYGDNGKAGGPFQFWNDTWIRMRKQMLVQGHIVEIGDRHNFRQAAHTTAWALANGRSKEWGPILRASKGNNYATCPVPSWSK